MAAKWRYATNVSPCLSPRFAQAMSLRYYCFDERQNATVTRQPFIDAASFERLSPHCYYRLLAPSRYADEELLFAATLLHAICLRAVIQHLRRRLAPERRIAPALTS